MKKIIATWLVCSLFLNLTAQDITGIWQGQITTGGKPLRIVFHITQKENNYEAKFDSPDQNAYGLATSSTKLMADSILISIDLIKGGYRGKWDGKDAITGTMQQGPGMIAMDLIRIKDASLLPKPIATKQKPQTPQPPFTYISEEVRYENAIEKNYLAGTLTKPTTGTKFPVVLLITGSGPQDRDETIGLHKPFALLADHLTKSGIAVLRVDDRGVGKSTGNFSIATSENFASDVMAGIQYLKTRNDIDITKIGLLGHSEGGMIAPYVAARSKDVSFMVLLAGPVVGGMQTMHYQAVEKPLALLSKHDQYAYQLLYDRMTNIAFDTAAANNLPIYIRKNYLEWKKQQPDSTLKNLVHGTDEEVIASFTKGFADFTRPWWRFFLSYDVLKDFEKIKIPVLALNGEKDEQVDPIANLAAIRKILAKHKNPNSKVVEVPGVNHLFQHCKACGSVAEYLALEETFDAATLDLIGKWIQEQTR